MVNTLAEGGGRAASKNPSIATRGVVTSAANRTASEQYLPSADLRDHVASFWSSWWDYRGETAREVEVLAHPNIHVVFEGSTATVVGIEPKRFVRRLDGQGRVFGIKFQPGAFFPQAGFPLSRLRGRQVPLGTALGVRGVKALAERILSGDDAVSIAEAETWLRGWLKPLDSGGRQVSAIVAHVLETPEVVQVEALATWAGLSARGLQRLFQTYLGVSPKWVIQRYRLHEAVEQLKSGRTTIAAVAASLGYFDQTHFVKDFKAKVGRPPSDFVKRVSG